MADGKDVALRRAGDEFRRLAVVHRPVEELVALQAGAELRLGEVSGSHFLLGNRPECGNLLEKDFGSADKVRHELLVDIDVPLVLHAVPAVMAQ